MKSTHTFLHLFKRKQHNWIKPVGFNTGIKIYNCKAREKVPLIVRNKHLVTWYTCGPTVYDSSHIGHASCYVKLDIIRRVLQNYFKLNIVTAMNITDIDDKIINKSNSTKMPIAAIVKFYEKEFWEDMHSLNVLKPHIIMRVSDYMPTIENFIVKLLDKGDAYTDSNGSILFRIQNYGYLQNINPQQTVNFTIWKGSKENEPFWNIKCGSGRPGWHTECSAIASTIFGSEIDIHAGGIDLRFPHHENEEAQCCAYFSKEQWVNYWLHVGHMMQNSMKMSKSLQNTMTIGSMLERCSGDVFRMMCLMSNYRKNMEFSEEYVHSAKVHLESFKNFLTNCDLIVNSFSKPHINLEILNECIKQSAEDIHNALTDDFDTATCIKIINNLIATVNKMLHNPVRTNHMQEIAPLISISNLISDILEIFGFNLYKTAESRQKTNETELINILTQFRQNVRETGLTSKNVNLLSLCDTVRSDLNKIGISIKDHKRVSSWTKI